MSSKDAETDKQPPPVEVIGGEQEKIRLHYNKNKLIKVEMIHK